MNADEWLPMVPFSAVLNALHVVRSKYGIPSLNRALQAPYYGFYIKTLFKRDLLEQEIIQIKA